MKNSQIININEILQIVPPERMLCIDTEGSANNIEQISIVDANESVRYDQHYAVTKLDATERNKIQSLLDQADILVGYNLNCDLKILASRQFKLPENTICADIFLTFSSTAVQSELAERHAWLSQKGGTLASVAEFYGEEPGKFHDSLFDACCTIRIFKKMIQRTEGEMVITKPPIKRLVAESARETTEVANKNPAFGILSSMPQLLNTLSGKIFGHFVDDHPAIYEGVVKLNGHFHVIRLTHREHSLFCKIQKYNPQYNLNTFYETILRPSQLEKASEKITE